MPTYIRFGDDHYISVREEPAEIRDRIEAAEAKRPPLIEVTRVDGTRVLANPETIQTITEGKKDGGGKD
jgi:hypothetical protein